MKPRITLKKEEKEEAIRSIISYFNSERDEDIGQLAATLILDFITENIGSIYYNQGIKDSIAYMSDKVEDMYGLEL